MIAPASLADLLVVGGLTIDRFDDGATAPGGSVLHAARAAAQAGLRTIAVTTAGPEPVAADGLAELGAIADLHAAEAPATITYRHREGPEGRRLWLEATTSPIRLPDDVIGRLLCSAILFAPVAGEVPTPILRTWDDTWVRGAILQGWLRRTAIGVEVEPVTPAELPDDLIAAFAGLDVLIASREDLAAVADPPHEQITALRRRVGPGPILIVTDGVDGVWIDAGREPPRHLAVPWRVADVPTVGAGDAFAALLVARLANAEQIPRSRDEALAYAMRGVAEMLEARRA